MAILNRFRPIVLTLLATAALLPLHGQLSNATIKGTVTDPSGAVLPQANVELLNTGTGERREQRTTGDGLYNFAALPPGNYQVKAAAPGFSDWTGKLTLRVAQEAVVNAVMETASISTSVTVQDVTPVISTEASSLSDVKEYSRIQSLPLQNRDFRAILNFSPGVVSAGFAGQGQGYTRVNGIPGGSIDYLVDGMSASERYTNELQRLPQPIPTIQEIKVSTANANAEYSRPGMVEVVTKSGTNQFHGELFELNQNSALSAKTFHQQAVNFLVRNEFGGNFSGPVWLPKLYNGKNKTFFFVDAEGIRQRSAATERYIVPEAAWKKGDFSNYTDESGNLIKIYDPLTTRFDPATGAYVRIAVPRQRDPVQPFEPDRKQGRRATCRTRMSTSRITKARTIRIRMPLHATTTRWSPRKSTSLLGRTAFPAATPTRTRITSDVGYFLNPNTRLYGGHNAALSYTELIKPSMINEIRGGVQRFHAYRGPALLDPPITETLGLPTYPGTVAWPSFYFGDSWTLRATSTASIATIRRTRQRSPSMPPTTSPGRAASTK